jgi:hypothetical protein
MQNWMEDRPAYSQHWRRASFDSLADRTFLKTNWSESILHLDLTDYRPHGQRCKSDHVVWPCWYRCNCQSVTIIASSLDATEACVAHAAWRTWRGCWACHTLRWGHDRGLYMVGDVCAVASSAWSKSGMRPHCSSTPTTQKASYWIVVDVLLKYCSTW